jgi:hypothetical protein
METYQDRRRRGLSILQSACPREVFHNAGCQILEELASSPHPAAKTDVSFNPGEQIAHNKTSVHVLRRGLTLTVVALTLSPPAMGNLMIKPSQLHALEDARHVATRETSMVRGHGRGSEDVRN